MREFSNAVDIINVDLLSDDEVQLPSNINPRKRSWKGKAAASENERNQGNHFFEKCFQK